MTTKKTGLGQRFYVGGYALAGDVGSFQRIQGGLTGTIPMTGIDKLAYERVGGHRDGAIDWTSFFNDAPDQAHDVLSPLPRTDVICTLLTAATIGAPACSEVAKQVGYDPDRPEDGSFTFNVETLANGYGLDWGEALTDGERTDTTGTNGASWDYTAAQTDAFGFQMFVHLLAITGTNVTIKVQDSANNSAFTDVTGATTAALSAGRTAVRIAAVPAVIRRYVRVVTSGTFTSATFVVGFTRNEVAVSF